MRYQVVADTSGHNLPIGATVEPCEGPEWSSPDIQWFTQGGDGDEVAIELSDLAEVSA